MAISKIEIVPIRQAFGHEALDFTVWLESNIDALSERLGLDLTVLEREKSVGSFNVDLFCEDAQGNTVIIENQLERTDHDHLGKLLTYMINLEAKTAIWVATDIRQEHHRVIDWLNESTAADMAFYLVQVEAIRIDDSPYAPLFTTLAHPDEQTREIGQKKKELAERHYLREEFWDSLITLSEQYTNLLSGRTPGKEYWYSIGAGKSGCGLNLVIFTDYAAVELYIDTGDYDKNKLIFDRLYAEKDRIEAEFGNHLEWQRLDEKRASRIKHSIHGQGSVYTQDQWPALQEVMVQCLMRLNETMRKRIRLINV